ALSDRTVHAPAVLVQTFHDGHASAETGFADTVLGATLDHDREPLRVEAGQSVARYGAVREAELGLRLLQRSAVVTVPGQRSGYGRRHRPARVDHPGLLQGDVDTAAAAAVQDFLDLLS